MNDLRLALYAPAWACARSSVLWPWFVEDFPNAPGQPLERVRLGQELDPFLEDAVVHDHIGGVSRT